MWKTRFRMPRLYITILAAAMLICGGFLAFRVLPAERVIARVTRTAPGIINDVTRTVKFELDPGDPVKLPENTISPEVSTITPATSIPAPVNGPLRVSPENPRYFADASGDIVYLTGSHTWSNLQDNGNGYPPPEFNYTAYLDFLKANNHNFFRLWSWEQSRWTVETTDDNYWFYPMPFQRTGPGTAIDGQLRFDLTRFNQAYFDRMRARIIAARDRGIYVSIMLFDGWSIESSKGGLAENNPWKGHPFNKNNNINGINGDPNGDNSGLEVHTLAIPAVTNLQKAYVRKVIDTVNDLDNVLYEISNESDGGSTAWQYEMIRYIKEYEAGKPRQHPVGMTFEYPGGSNDDLYNSPADWVSPNETLSPPVASGQKVIIADTDHICGVCGDRDFIWKAFTRGANPIYMDIYDGAAYGVGANGFDPADPNLAITRKNMGYTLFYANRMNLKAAVPKDDATTSTGYSLVNLSPGKAQILVYAPRDRRQFNVSVDLSDISGEVWGEWMNPETGTVHIGLSTTGGGVRSFTPPFNGDAVLFLYQEKLTFREFYLPVIFKFNLDQSPELLAARANGSSQ